MYDTAIPVKVYYIGTATTFVLLFRLHPTNLPSAKFIGFLVTIGKLDLQILILQTIFCVTLHEIIIGSCMIVDQRLGKLDLMCLDI